MTTTKTIESLKAEIKTLESVEHMTETNDGTYGSAEACRAVGSGDPAFATRRVYETVGGRKRATGPDEIRSPGRMRKLNRDALADDRRKLAALREELRRLDK